MGAYGVGIPRFYFHHQILFNAIDGVVFIKLFLGRRHEIAQARVLAVADQAQIAERVKRVSIQLNLSV
ncbi:hypothetical protein D3C80_2130490 [compost metagenome]